MKNAAWLLEQSATLKNKRLWIEQLVLKTLTQALF